MAEQSCEARLATWGGIWPLPRRPPDSGRQTKRGSGWRPVALAFEDRIGLQVFDDRAELIPLEAWSVPRGLGSYSESLI